MNDVLRLVRALEVDCSAQALSLTVTPSGYVVRGVDAGGEPFTYEHPELDEVVRVTSRSHGQGHTLAELMPTPPTAGQLSPVLNGRYRAFLALNAQAEAALRDLNAIMQVELPAEAAAFGDSDDEGGTGEEVAQVARVRNIA